jgi:uncharacterized membrane-anchored protein YhcB (DUF1043 family)
MYQATQVVQSATAQWISFLNPLMVAVLGYLYIRTTKEAAKRSDRVEAKTDEVKNTLAHTTTATTNKIDALAAETHSVHTLVNNQYGIALALILEKSLKLYAANQSEENFEEVNRAKATLADHVAKQQAVDEKK